MARTAMIDFNVDSKSIAEADKRIALLEKLNAYVATLGFVSKHEPIQMGEGYLVVYSKPMTESSLIIRLYKEGLVSLTIEELHLVDLTNSKLEDVRKELVKLFKTRVEKTPSFKHALEVPVYFDTSEERILEYDFDNVAFEAESPYQNIKILSSPTLGNCLILDDHQNLGDCDIAYTHGLMKFGEISYKDKEIFIMGGGDGGLLHELLKEQPKFVTMVDIDQMVIDACRVHLRGCCGNSMDQLTGLNYQVIVDDCIKIMEQYVEKGRSFDYVFNDLTDIPIATSPQGEPWEFVRKIVTLGLKLTRPTGRYLNHAIGATCFEALNKYEDLLKSLPEKVEFTRHSAFVPSFIETWAFYEVWKTAN